MTTNRNRQWAVLGCAFALVMSLTIVKAQGPAGSRDDDHKSKKVEKSERDIQAADVPAAAMAALKKIAGDAKLTEFEEESEHGAKYYEAEWMGPNGKMEAKVTADGDLVEIEEAISPTAVPKAIRENVEKHAGKGVEVSYEKKTFIVYEAKITRNGKHSEVMMTADGHMLHDNDGDRDDHNDHKRHDKDDDHDDDEHDDD